MSILNDLCPIILKDNIIEKKQINIDQNEGYTKNNIEPNPKLTSSNPVSKHAFNQVINTKYEEAYNLMKKSKENKETIEKQEKVLLKQINSMLPISNADKSSIELLSIHCSLLRKAQLATFEKLALKNKFNLKEKILTWIQKIYNIVHRKQLI